MAPYLKTMSLRIVGDAESIYSEIAKTASINGRNITDITEKSLKDMCTQIHLYESAPMLISVTINVEEQLLKYVNASWIYFLIDRQNRSKKSIEDILKYMLYLESEHVKLLTNINSNSYFSYLEHVFSTKPVHFGNSSNPGQDLSFIADQMYQYFLMAKELKIFIEREFK